MGWGHQKRKSRGHLFSEKPRLDLDHGLNSFGSQSENGKSHSSKKIKEGSGPTHLGYSEGRENNFSFYRKRRSRILLLDSFLGQK